MKWSDITKRMLLFNMVIVIIHRMFSEYKSTIVIIIASIQFK